MRPRIEFNPICIAEALTNFLDKLTLQQSKKFRNPYYPPTVRRTIRRKILVHKTRRRVASSTQKNGDSVGDDGDPVAQHPPQILFSACTFNIGDINKNIHNEEEQLPSALRHDIELADIKAQLAEALQRAENAEQSLAEAQQQLTTSSLSSAQKAAQSKSEKTLMAWKPAIAAMIKVAVRCGAEGKAPRQKPDFYTLFNEIDAELTDTQMAFFRSSLPEGYSDKDGGKPGKV